MVTENSCNPNLKISIYLKFLFYNLKYTYNLKVSARNVLCGQQCIHSLWHVTSKLYIELLSQHSSYSFGRSVLTYHVNLEFLNTFSLKQPQKYSSDTENTVPE